MRYAIGFIPDEDEAREIVQDCLMKIYDKDELRINTSVQAYLYRSVYNSIVNYFEHKKVHDKYISRSKYRLAEIERETFEDTWIEDEKLAILNKEIEKLPPKSRLVLKMKFFEGKKYKVISSELGISERTVEAHLAKAIKTLKCKLKKLRQ